MMTSAPKQLIRWLLSLSTALSLMLSTGHTEDYGCGMTFCGCSKPVTLTFETSIVDTNNTPIKGIQIICGKEPEPIATSDANGIARFSIETEYTPGCHHARCENLRFVDPSIHSEK